ncbi:MAG: hypothetical protein ACLFN8_00245 [Candidatus Woesearchaeota archaeon]
MKYEIRKEDIKEKYGNTYIELPQDMAEMHNLAEGDTVEVSLNVLKK